MRHSKNRAFLFVLCVLAAQAAAVEHPGALTKDAICSSCHENLIRGTSVHSVMATTCNVCHVATTQGDMTILTLSMPKERICFACHEQANATRQHQPDVKGQCLDCHDAHSSNRRMLLRQVPLK